MKEWEWEWELESVALPLPLLLVLEEEVAEWALVQEEDEADCELFSKASGKMMPEETEAAPPGGNAGMIFSRQSLSRWDWTCFLTP